MEEANRGISRRDLLRGMGATAVGAAAAGAASTGCAGMPRAGKGKGTHPCDSPHCRYYRAPRLGKGSGSCVLVLREKGGLP